MVISLQISAVSGESVAKLFRSLCLNPWESLWTAEHSSLQRIYVPGDVGMKGKLGGGEEEEPHVWNEDLSHDHNNHNHDNEITPRAHTCTWCNRVKRPRVQLLRCWITVLSRDQWWRSRWETFFLSVFLFIVCLCSTKRQTCRARVLDLMQSLKYQVLRFQIIILGTLITMKLHNEVIVLWRSLRSEKDICVKRGVNVSQTQQN